MNEDNLDRSTTYHLWALIASLVSGVVLMLTATAVLVFHCDILFLLGAFTLHLFVGLVESHIRRQVEKLKVQES